MRCLTAISILSIATGTLVIACQSSDVITARDLGPLELQISAYSSLLAETGNNGACVAAADAFTNRRPALGASDEVMRRLKAVFPNARPYSQRCEQKGRDVVVIAWVERYGDTATIGASRWYGHGVRGGVICDVILSRTAGGQWRVVRPCMRSVSEIIN